MKNLFKFSLLLFLFITIKQGFSQTNFFEFKLNDIKNSEFNFATFSNNKATAVVIMLSDCPATQSYSLTLNKLFEKYKDKKVNFVGVFPSTYSTDEELTQFQNEYKVNFTMVKDPGMVLCKYLKATTAPQCFVVDSQSKIVYSGRIDDWLYALGKKKLEVTENNLDDALKAVINNQPVKVKSTRPIGCILEYE